MDMYKEIISCLEWYVENDDTNIGQEGNEFWEQGLYRALKALKEVGSNSNAIALLDDFSPVSPTNSKEGI